MYNGVLNTFKGNINADGPITGLWFNIDSTYNINGNTLTGNVNESRIKIKECRLSKEDNYKVHSDLCEFIYGNSPRFINADQSTFVTDFDKILNNFRKDRRKIYFNSIEKPVITNLRFNSSNPNLKRNIN